MKNLTLEKFFKAFSATVCTFNNQPFPVLQFLLQVFIRRILIKPSAMFLAPERFCIEADLPFAKDLKSGGKPALSFYRAAVTSRIVCKAQVNGWMHPAMRSLLIASKRK
jgi:hypothetical protein